MHDPERRKNSEEDHDLLLNINSKQNNFVDIFETFIKDYKDGHKDHELRLRFLEHAIWLGMGGLAILQILLRFYI
jgi:hypothetical protein